MGNQTNQLEKVVVSKAYRLKEKLVVVLVVVLVEVLVEVVVVLVIF